MLALLLLFAQPTLAKTPVCSPGMFGSCETFAHLPLNLSGSKALKLPVAPGGTMIYNSLVSVIGDKNPAPPKETAEQAARAGALGRQAIAAAKEVVTGGVPEAYLTPEQRAILARLEAVHVKVPKNSDPECKTKKHDIHGAPDASYAEEVHQLDICPAAANLAPASLLLMLTHEIGHSISPCTMAKKFYRTNPEKLGHCGLTKEELKSARDSVRGGYTTFPTGAALDPELAAGIKKLEKCGALGEVKQASFTGQGAFYAKLTACLDSRYADAWKKFLKKDRFDSYDKAPGGDASLRCIGIYDEHFADVFGARVFGKLLETADQPAEMARVAMMEPATSVCAANGEPKPDDYPSDTERFFLHASAPSTQKALGCVMPKIKSCGMGEVFTYPQVPSATEETPVENSSAE